jgi:hypothetical protein
VPAATSVLLDGVDPRTALDGAVLPSASRPGRYVSTLPRARTGSPATR